MNFALQQEQLMLLMSINGAVDPHYLIDQLVRYTGNENAVTLIFERQSLLQLLI